MSHDTVQLAQLNRKANKAVAQKENSEFVIRPFQLKFNWGVFHAEIFWADEAACERWSECMYHVHDRLSEQPTKSVRIRSSESSLGYMVKRLSAYGGCLGSKRR